MNRAERREHLAAVIASARLRGEPGDSLYAEAAMNSRNPLSSRTKALRWSITEESVSGDRPYHEAKQRKRDQVWRNGR